MKIGKIAIALAALVIISLIIFATITNIIPETFDFFNCAFKVFLTPGNTESSLSSCVNGIDFKFR